jgi:hypothetical protein
MSPRDKKICEAWKQAAKVFGLVFSTPYVVKDYDGVEYEYLGLVHHVGADTGTLIATEDTCPSGNSRESEYSLSILSYDEYSNFDNEIFLEFLKDWGWYGGKHNTPSCFLQSNNQIHPTQKPRG